MVQTGAGPAFVAVDDLLHTLFTLNDSDNTLSETNTWTCNGAATWGCSGLARNERADPDQGPSFGANNVILSPLTGTAYLVNEGGPSILTIVSVSRCNAIDTSGCRPLPAPTVPDYEFLSVVDPATNTIYASNRNLPQVDVINGATCNVSDLAGCTPVAEIPVANPRDQLGAIDDATHTLYVADFSGTVSVINTATCNASDTVGCAGPWSSIAVGPYPGIPAINSATGTLYVPVGDQSNEVAVVNTATCNAEQSSGCAQVPATVTVGQGTFGVAVSVKTNTVYAPDTGFGYSGDTVDVINGATCDGTHLATCGPVAAIATVGAGPQGIAVDDATNTVYVANNADGVQPGTLSVLNGATCNGTVTSGCSAISPTVGIGRSPLTVALDTATGKVFVADFASAAVSVLNGSACNAEVTWGCPVVAPEQVTGSQPYGLSVDQATRTIYALNYGPFGNTSIFGE